MTQVGQGAEGSRSGFLAGFLPHQPVTRPREIVRAGVGACLGIAVTGAVSTWWLGQPGGVPLLIAPMGASTVLLFGVPASPLAQPYAILGGNILAALIGVTAARLIGVPVLAAGIAVALALVAMAVCRCIHPPSGAVALTAILGGPKVIAAGYAFVAVPVLLNTVILVGMAIAWSRLTGLSYPHVGHRPRKLPDPAPPHQPTLADFEAAIANYGETLTIDAADLAVLYKSVATAAPH